MKLGLESFSARNAGLDPIGVLKLTADLGLAGVLFEFSPFTSFRDDDLAAIRQHAEENDLFIDFGMGSLFRWHPMAEKCIGLLDDAGYDTNVSEAGLVIHHLKVAEKLGARLMRLVGGNLFSRDEGHDMTKLADDAVVILREACRAAEDMGIKIAMENHADFTVRQLMSILGRVGSPAFGFTLDCANVAFDLDDPLRLAKILAPHVFATHYKNYRILRTTTGLALESCALGDGEIDIVAMAEVLAKNGHDPNVTIEIHSQFAPFRLDILDPTFFQRHESPPGDGLAWYLEKAWQKELLEPNFTDLPDGAESWKVEEDHLKRSVQWAQERLSHILS